MILHDFPYSAYKNDNDVYFKIELISEKQTNIRYFDPVDLSLVKDFIIDMPLHSRHYVNDNYLIYHDLNEKKRTYYTVDPLNDKIQKSDSSVFEMGNFYNLKDFYDFETGQTIIYTFDGKLYKTIEKDESINTSMIYTFGSILENRISEELTTLSLIDLFSYATKWERRYVEIINLRHYKDKLIIKYISKRHSMFFSDKMVCCLDAMTGNVLWEYDADTLSVYEEIGQACCLKHEKIKATGLIKSVKVAFIDIMTGKIVNSYYITPHREDIWISEGNLMGNYRNYGTTKWTKGFFNIKDGKIKYEFLFADNKGKKLGVSNYYLLGNGNIYLITFDGAFIINPEENKEFAIVWDGVIQREL